ncbi:hypothetical protein M3223_02560 [Paenibacillus pasadenensis]|uniref:hypothetical protein n=1 Tax=Paenibacillus pasadenensis TaxID=217090 RepID=UPI0020405D64|nr:hypothetical protein [Paenibacillus pasadenensis]MCM3746231.1 hypothetical protein [Paenibacillus pasadenensis]
MNTERNRISSVNGKSLGIILILFILLVIVTRVCTSKNLPDNEQSIIDNDSFDIAGSQDFVIVNYSSYLFYVNVYSGDVKNISNSINLAPYGGENTFRLTTKFNSSTSGNVAYASLSSARLFFTVSQTPGSGSGSFSNISIQGPITAYISSVSNFRLVVHDEDNQ